MLYPFCHSEKRTGSQQTRFWFVGWRSDEQSLPSFRIQPSPPHHNTGKPILCPLSFRAPLLREESLLSPTKLRCQVLPTRIHFLNQRNFLLPTPTLNLLLPCNRVSHILESFKVHQPVDSILLCKPGDLAQLMLDNSAIKIIGHAHVKSPRKTRN